MYSLIYASRCTNPLSSEEVELILNASRQNNDAMAITGVLFFNSTQFLQCLEGPRNTVENLYNKIIQDPRHHDVTTLTVREITTREFGGWSMGYFGLTSETKELFKEYSEDPDFDLFTLSSNQACQFTLSLTDLIPSVH